MPVSLKWIFIIQILICMGLLNILFVDRKLLNSHLSMATFLPFSFQIHETIFTNTLKWRKITIIFTQNTDVNDPLYKKKRLKLRKTSRFVEILTFPETKRITHLGHSCEKMESEANFCCCQGCVSIENSKGDQVNFLVNFIYPFRNVYTYFSTKMSQ